VKVSEIIRRARSALSMPIKYKMGSGGMDPTAASPAGVDGACDCSGFISWVLGVSRKTKDPLYLRVTGGWRNTDGMAIDAKEPGGMLTVIPGARVGCLMVYGKGWRGAYVGHVGLVTDIWPPPENMPANARRVIHCASGHRIMGNAVQETAPAAFFKRNAIYAWPDFLIEG